MKAQSLISGKNKKNIINVSSAEFAHRTVKVKHTISESINRKHKLRLN